ncbi:MAG: response regulator [Thaumarchaeota archaeon]|nr:response regulator [Nitrososphaerota archaeon]
MSIKAIVIDDSNDIKRVFVELLQFNNIQVVGTGSNGREAAELYQKLKPDVVFMDAMMPRYDGFYGLEKIREQDPKSIVFLVTGSINVEDKLDNCNATAILPKPIDMSMIMDTIGRFCMH